MARAMFGAETWYVGSAVRISRDLALIDGLITDLFFPASEPQGHVAVLDTRTGRLLRTLAVDEQAGSVVVVDAGNQFRLRRLDAWGWVPSWLRPWLPFLPAPPPRTGAIPGTVTVLDTSRL